MSEMDRHKDGHNPIGADKVAVAYILGGIPAIVGFVVILFALVSLNRNIPA